MTAPRGKIEASLAERGRPAMWANEQEAAIMSGYTPDSFRSALPGLEKLGFPQINALNGKRFIPAIINFWACQVDSMMPGASNSPDDGPDGQEVETFGNVGTKRRSA